MNLCELDSFLDWDFAGLEFLEKVCWFFSRFGTRKIAGHDDCGRKRRVLGWGKTRSYPWPPIWSLAFAAADAYMHIQLALYS
jgi:hypothetical protein